MTPHDRCIAAGLNNRDAKLLRLVAIGAQDKQIAEEMGYGLSTVRNYLSAIYDKIGVNGRVTAALWLHGVPTP